MHVIGKQATSNTRDSLNALQSSRRIDPLNPIWNSVDDLLSTLYEILQRCQTYLPAADGSDLGQWLQKNRNELEPFVERLFDELLADMVTGLEVADESWERYGETTVLGNRNGAIDALTQATNAVTTLSPTLSGWFNQLRNLISNAAYVERHAIVGGIGRALADGWEAFDKGQLAETERLGQQAYEVARTEQERFASERMRRLAHLVREWIDRKGIQDQRRTQSAQDAIEEMFTRDEKSILENFSRQMPSTETYLRAMSRGLVEAYNRQSTAALRLLFIHFVLMGAIEAQEDQLSDAEFWLEARQ